MRRLTSAIVILDGNFVHALLETKCAALPLLLSSGAGTTRLFLGCLLSVCNLLTGFGEPSKTSMLAAGSESRARCWQSCWEGQ